MPKKKTMAIRVLFCGVLIGLALAMLTPTSSLKQLSQLSAAPLELSKTVRLTKAFSVAAREVPIGPGNMTTFAGTGISGSSGDGGPAAAAQLTIPEGMAVDTAGNLYSAEFFGHRVRKVDPSGTISTFAGTGVFGSTGDGGPATAAQLAGPGIQLGGQPVLTRNNILIVAPAGSGTITSNHLQVVAAGTPASQIVYTLVSPLPAKGQVKRNGTLVGWLLNPSTGHYYTSTAPGHRGATAAEAASYGAFLTTINNAAENVWITTNFSRVVNAYNGLNDPGGWDNGESSAYRNWYPGEPNSGQETAVHMYLNVPDGEGAQWNDIDPNQPVHPGIVEKNNSSGILLSFTQADIDEGRVTYQHFAGSYATTPADPDDFTFTVSDGAGGIISSTVFQITVDSTAPMADIVDVTPDPRADGAATITIGFTEAVNAFDLQDLQLRRDGGSNLLTAAQTLTTSDNITWTLGNLSGLTGAPGSYTLTLTAAGSGITDAFGTALAGGSSDTWVVFGPAPQTITFGALANKTFGDPPFTVNATASSDLPVSFSIVSGPATITGNNVTLAGAGTVVVRASQPGNGNYNAATPVDQSFTVFSSGTSTTVSSSANPSVLGQIVTFTATVKSSGGTPTGTVTFKDGGTVLGTGTLSFGNATFATTNLSAGPHPITTHYSGDANSNPSDYAMFFQQVNVACTGTPGFVAAPGVGVGGLPTFAAVGDFNSDGKQDLAVTNRGSNYVHILLGNGSGGFIWPSSVAVGSQPWSVAVGEFNGDGKQDLAVANSNSNNVTVLLGDGMGEFSSSSTLAAGNVPLSVAIGDFNSDGKQDLAVANNSSNNVTILLGNGSGGFSASSSPSVGSMPWSVAVGEFNSDGKQDLAVANFGPDNVTILLGNGNGGFSTSSSPSVGINPESVAVGDFNQDGKQDLAVANSLSNNVTILLGNGSGGFSTSSSPGVGNFPLSLAVGDFNGDGKQDLAVANNGSANITILLGDGSGGFSTSSSPSVSPGSDPRSVAVGDFNGDGRQDLAVSKPIVTILLNTCLDSAPNINASPVTRAAGEPAANSQIATVSDAEDAPAILTVKINGGTTATVNGVTVTLNPPSPNASGQVFADVAASCTATNATFTLAVTDSANQMTTATLTVTVTPDRTAPLVTAPAPTVASANGSCQAAIPNVIPGTTASDNCSGTVTLMQTPAAGALVGIGSHTITVTATDAAGNSSTATTAFTVTDTTPPTPNVTTLPTITGECSVTVTAPTATDSCAGQITGTTTDPTSYSSQGTFIMHWTYSDGNGNTSTQTQTVVVHDTTAPAPNAASLPTVIGECSATITAPTATDNCAGQVVGTTTDPTSYTTPGTFLVQWTYSDGNGNSSAQSQTVIVQDTTQPAFGSTPSTNGLAAYYKFDEVSGIDTPDSSGNFRDGQLIGTSWINTGLPSLGFANPYALSFNGTSEYVLIPRSAIDNLSAGTIAAWVYLNTRDQEVITAKQHNNSDSMAVFAVGLSGASNTPSDIQTPGVLYFHAKNATGFNASGVTTLNTGEWYHVAVTFTTTQAKIYVDGVLDSTTNGDFSIPTDLSGAAPTTIGAWIGDGLIDGRNTNYLDGRLDDVRIYDRALSDSEIAAFVSGAPPANITQSADSGACSAVVNFSPPIATDNCATPVPVSCDHASGSTFAVGTTTVTCTATDAGSNPATTSFTVTVNDGTAPVPNVATLPTVTGECSATIGSAPTATDSCAGQVTGTTTDPTSYTTQGTFIVHWTYEDGHGNTSTQMQTVIVVDNTPPVISCPANVTVTANLGSTSAAASYPAAAATDNCGVPIVSCSIASGSSFAIGTTTVSCTATDSSNNAGSCAFTVTVLTPQGTTQQLVNNVDSLVSQGVLNQGNGNALVAKLQAAINSMDNGNTTAACNELQAFINQTQAFINSGKLTPAQGQSLIDAANALKSALGC